MKIKQEEKEGQEEEEEEVVEDVEEGVCSREESMRWGKYRGRCYLDKIFLLFSL